MGNIYICVENKSKFRFYPILISLAGESIRILPLLFHPLFFSVGETGTTKPDAPSKIHQWSYTLCGYPDVNSAFYDLAVILTSGLRCAENYQEKRIPCVFLLHL